jgi:hypothetical protein
MVEVLSDIADAIDEQSGHVLVTPEDNSQVEVEVPRWASQPAEVTTDVGTLTLEVPGIGRDQAPMDDTMAVFDGAGADTVVAVQGTDGLRALVHIDSAQAPERFDFPIGGDVASLRLTASGGVDALNGEGEVIATASAPWAVDANGADVPTRYEINGTTLTQVVEHRDGNYAYGIVADPCFTCFLSTAWQIAKCASAITVAIAGVAVPLSKVVKIKRLVDEVGGVTKLAERIIKVAKGEGSLGSRVRAVFSDLGTTVVALAAEVLGLQAIADECF